MARVVEAGCGVAAGAVVDPAHRVNALDPLIAQRATMPPGVDKPPAAAG